MGPKKSTFILEEIDLLILSTQRSHSSVIELADLIYTLSFFPESVFSQFLNELFISVMMPCRGFFTVGIHDHLVVEVFWGSETTLRYT